jgi:hypothetical protein
MDDVEFVHLSLWIRDHACYSYVWIQQLCLCLFVCLFVFYLFSTIRIIVLLHDFRSHGANATLLDHTDCRILH